MNQNLNSLYSQGPNAYYIHKDQMHILADLKKLIIGELSQP